MKFEDGIDTMITNEDTAEQKEKYVSPAVVCYGDIRDITLGGSIDPGESGGALKAPGDQFEGSLFEERGSIGGSGSGSGDSGGRTGRN
jgi:hypothetical protein